jgi:hypothetical protein
VEQKLGREVGPRVVVERRDRIAELIGRRIAFRSDDGDELAQPEAATVTTIDELEELAP